ncbi:hypothetical protein DFH07DRAFT_956203 [Mycena maculata]|uniref:F-box domain-containing protein n=1 Tax=Mycena maculata TaxID=230809 RepID=A0AAD7NKH0_9AGAR|nr:hypothetical protein DFH07DRAFT_956203 [Mycena maculata]
MPFAVLGDDILLKILLLCDVYTVLMLSTVSTRAGESRFESPLTNLQVNKLLRRIALVKQLWLSLINTGAFRRALDLPPSTREELENRSTRKLMDLVKRIVIGPNPWWPSSSPSAIRRYTITSLADIETNFDSFVLPGGRYMVLQSHTRENVCIYDIWSNRGVWSYTATSFTNWKFDLVPGSAIARVLVAVPVERFAHHFRRDICIEEVDLTTGLSREVFSLHFGFKSVSTFSGDFFLYAPPPFKFIDVYGPLMVINWRASTYVVLDYGTSPNSSAVLIPGYLVAAYSECASPTQLVLTVTQIDAFIPYWKPLSEISFKDKLSPDDISFAVFQRLQYNNHPLGDRLVRVRLTAVPSALYRGAYNIIVYAGQLQPIPETPTLAMKIGQFITGRRQAPQSSPRPALLSYRFTPPLSPGQPCGWRLISAERAAFGFDAKHLSPPRVVVERSEGSFVASYCPQ